jgi:hypothetical protein
MEVQNYHLKMYVEEKQTKNSIFLSLFFLNSSFLPYKKLLVNPILVQCTIILLKLAKDQQLMFI